MEDAGRSRDDETESRGKKTTEHLQLDRSMANDKGQRVCVCHDVDKWKELMRKNRLLCVQ